MSGSSSWSDHVRLSLLRIDRSAALGLAVLAVVAVVAAAAFAVHARPHTVAFAGDGSAPASTVPSVAATVGAGTGAASSVAGRTVVVDVAGRVRRPGLVTVPAGSRVADVVRAAGGFRKPSDARSVNQARVVVDGEQVVVGGGSAAPGAAPGPGTGTSGEAAPVDLNAATLDQLESLPGVGPVLAQRILDRRTASGPFRSVDELRDVSGIGDKTFADIAPHVRV